MCFHPQKKVDKIETDRTQDVWYIFVMTLPCFNAHKTRICNDGRTRKILLLTINVTVLIFSVYCCPNSVVMPKCSVGSVERAI